jgi:hypothetical protein
MWGRWVMMGAGDVGEWIMMGVGDVGWMVAEVTVDDMGQKVNTKIERSK